MRKPPWVAGSRTQPGGSVISNKLGAAAPAQIREALSGLAGGAVGNLGQGQRGKHSARVRTPHPQSAGICSDRHATQANLCPKGLPGRALQFNQPHRCRFVAGDQDAAPRSGP